MAGPRGFDPIAIVECSYALQGSESEWIDRLLEAVAPAIDQGIGVYGYTYRSNGERPVITATASGNPTWERVLLEMRDNISSDYVAATIGVRRPLIATARLAVVPFL
jgi:hypothetical protein